MNDEECQCPRCGRLHKNLGFGTPPASIRDQKSALPSDEVERVARADYEAAHEWHIKRHGRYSYISFADAAADVRSRQLFCARAAIAAMRPALPSEPEVREMIGRLHELDKAATPGPWTLLPEHGLHHPAWVMYAHIYGEEQAKAGRGEGVGALCWANDDENSPHDVEWRGGKNDETLVAFLRSHVAKIADMLSRVSAGRDAVLEEAAQIADAHTGEPVDRPEGMDWAKHGERMSAIRIGKKIRALKSSAAAEPGQQKGSER